MWGKQIIRPRNRKRGKQERIDPKISVYLLACFLFPLLSSCATLPDPESTQDFNDHSVAVINAEQSVGQTFVSRRARLNGIELWFKPAASALLKVELFHDLQETSPLFTGKVRAGDGKTYIAIPPQNDHPNQSYYLKISADQGEVEVLGRLEDNYAWGSAFVNDQPIPADLAFQATYEYEKEAAFSDLRRLLSIWEVLLPLGLLLLLPGWLLLDLCGLKDQFDLGERLGLAAGLSLAVIPLLMLWTSLIGLRWGTISIWFVIGILAAGLVWRWFREAQAAGQPPPESPGQSPTDDQPVSSPAEEITRPASLTFSILLAIFGLALFLRFAMVRDLAAPAWVDSIHHGLIPRLMLESGGLPDTYAPYLPVGADHYHFGYHSSLAAFIWLTGLEIHTAMLIFGQVLNALMAFSIYLLTKTLTKNRPASLAAALIVTAFTLMPAYYASWGRYTQLAGLLGLPAAFALIAKILQAKSLKEISKPTWLSAAITCAGLFLIHYRVAAFLGLLILAFLLAQVNFKQWPKAVGKLALLGLIIIVLLLPWLPDTFAQLLLPTSLKLSGGRTEFSAIPWNFLKPGLGVAALVLAGIGLVFGIISVRRFPLTVILWTGFLYLAANLGVFTHLPGSGFINPVSMEITLFMPIAILGGFAIGSPLEWLDKFIPQRWQILPRVIFMALGVWGGVLGAQRLLPTLNPVTFLAREADITAIEWIEENVLKDETIVINPAQWGYGLYMGYDGGFWISALSSHPTMPMPVIYGLGETSEVEYINQTSEAVRSFGEDPTALWELMQAENYHFVYTGARGGVISPQALSQSDLFTIRYHQDGTWVFETLEK